MYVAYSYGIVDVWYLLYILVLTYMKDLKNANLNKDISLSQGPQFFTFWLLAYLSRLYF